jgi:hypothetical protein
VTKKEKEREGEAEEGRQKIRRKTGKRNKLREGSEKVRNKNKQR